MAVGDEHRIIAESPVAARRRNEMARDLAREGDALPVGPGQTQDGGEVGARSVVCPRGAFVELARQPRHRQAEVPAGPGPAGGVDAGSPAERLDLEAGIIGQLRQASTNRPGDRLDAGVVEERRSGLLRLRQAKLRGRGDL